tara:strand:- start:769 stop:1026 length:258 start_codon:yes stop_codon:yes gene_type:complete
MRTITLDTEMTFNDALTYLMEGKCIGIRPTTNSSYIERYKPSWMNKESPDYMLKWSGADNGNEIRTNQYLESWYPVIVDHREIDA